MMYDGPIFRMRPIYGESLPDIDLRDHNFDWDDWKELTDPFPPGIDLLKCNTLEFRVNHPNATDRDFYFDYSGYETFGIISQRAHDLLWPFFDHCCNRLATTINNRPYYFLITSGHERPCVNIDLSDGTLCDYRPRFFTSSKRLRFYPESLEDPLVFVPAEAFMLLATQSIRKLVEAAGLNGFEFVDCDHLREYGSP